MNKTGDFSIRGNQWQRLLRWHRGQKDNEGGQDGVKDEEKRDTTLNLNLKLKVK